MLLVVQYYFLSL